VFRNPHGDRMAVFFLDEEQRRSTGRYIPKQTYEVVPCSAKGSTSCLLGLIASGQFYVNLVGPYFFFLFIFGGLYRMRHMGQSLVQVYTMPSHAVPCCNAAATGGRMFDFLLGYRLTGPGIGGGRADPLVKRA
jgi:hypothetical protein